MTSYQRLKKENEELRRQLFVVCVIPDSLEGRTVVLKENAIHKMEVALWAGGEHLRNPDGSKFEGFIKYVNTQ